MLETEVGHSEQVLWLSTVSFHEALTQITHYRLVNNWLRGVALHPLHNVSASRSVFNNNRFI